MKYIKTYETLNEGTPEIGDYVIIRMWTHLNGELMNFINNNIGQIAYKSSLGNELTIKYDNVPGKLQTHFVFPGSLSKDKRLSRTFHKNEILYFSKDKTELEFELKVSKYNL